MNVRVELWGSHEVDKPTTHYRDYRTGVLKPFMNPLTGEMMPLVETCMTAHERAAAWTFLASSRPIGMELHTPRYRRWQVTFDQDLGDLPADILDWLFGLMKAGNLIAHESSGIDGIPHFAASDDVRRRAQPILKTEIVTALSGEDIARIYRDRRARVRRSRFRLAAAEPAP